MRRVLAAIVGLSFLAGVLVTMPDDPAPRLHCYEDEVVLRGACVPVDNITHGIYEPGR